MVDLQKEDNHVLVIFKDKGVNPPESFIRSDKDVCTSGLLPLMLIDSSEEEICHEICSIINNCATHNYLKLLLMILNLSA